MFYSTAQSFLLVSVNIHLWEVNYWPRASRTAAVLGRLCSDCRRAGTAGSGPRGQLLDLRKAVHGKASNSAQLPRTGAEQAGRTGCGHPRSTQGSGKSRGELKQLLQGPTAPAKLWEGDKQLKPCRLLQTEMWATWIMTRTIIVTKKWQFTRNGKNKKQN